MTALANIVEIAVHQSQVENVSALDSTNHNPQFTNLVEGRDFYYDGPYMVFTADYLRRRGYCCGSGCRHCPYDEEEQRRAGRPGSGK